MKMWTILFVFVGTLTFISADDDQLQSLADANNQLAHQLHQILKAEDNGNIFISPLSITTALSMLMRGARKDTQDELYRYLGFDEVDLTQNEVHSAFKKLLEKLNSAEDDYELHLANSILAQKDFPINGQFREDMKSLYKAQVQNVDFKSGNSEVIKSINTWVSQVTKGNIKSLVESLDTDTVMVLLNAIYFKGTWKTEFDPKDTRSMAFHNHGSKQNQKQVPMMQREDTYKYAYLTGVSAIELPYEGGDISMVLLIPDTMDGITKLEAALTPNFVGSNIFRDVRRRMRETKLTLYLPKFKIEYKKELSDVLQKLGIKKIFQGDADFTGISSSGNLQVSSVNHKSVIEVNEHGSEAAGATDVGISFKMGGMQLLADHPFLFAIIDTKTNMVLFHGRVSEL